VPARDRVPSGCGLPDRGAGGDLNDRNRKVEPAEGPVEGPVEIQAAVYVEAQHRGDPSLPTGIRLLIDERE